MISGIVFLTLVDGEAAYLVRLDDPDRAREITATFMECEASAVTVRQALGEELAAWEAWAATFGTGSEVSPVAVSIADARRALVDPDSWPGRSGAEFPRNSIH